MHACKDNPEKSPTTKESKHTVSGYSKSTIYVFHDKKDRHDR